MRTENFNRSDAFKTSWTEAKTTVKPNDIISKAKAFKELQAQIELLQAQADEIKKGIIEEMGGKEEITADIFTIKYITVIRNILDTQNFKNDHKDLYNSYLKENSSKRFTVSA